MLWFAVKITLVPAQILVPGFREMLAVGVTFVVTTIVIMLLVAVVGLGQAAELVM